MIRVPRLRAVDVFTLCSALLEPLPALGRANVLAAPRVWSDAVYGPPALRKRPATRRPRHK